MAVDTQIVEKTNRDADKRKMSGAEHKLYQQITGSLVYLDANIR